MTGTAGRRLRLPADTALDRAWKRRQWRLQQAHDDWGLHARSGDPRAPIHSAAGLVRLRRQSVRSKVTCYRRVLEHGGDRSPAAIGARCALVQALGAYRSAIGNLAQAVAAFDERNRAFIRRLPSGRCEADAERGSPTLLPALHTR